MSKHEKYVYAPRFFSQSSQITEIMNAKLDSPSEKRLRKLKMIFGLTGRKSPEIPQNLSRKRKLQGGERSKEKRSRNNEDTTKGTTPRKRRQGMSCDAIQDDFSFPLEASPRTENTDSEVKQSVLKTITRMLEENSALRQRQLMLTQVTHKKS